MVTRPNLPTRQFPCGARLRPPYQCELEYIESTGTQYVDTGMTVSDNLVVDATFCKTNTTTGFVFGARENANTKSFCFVSMSTYGRFDFGSGLASAMQHQTASVIGNSLKSFHADSSGFSLDGVSTAIWTNSFSLDKNVVLFAVNTNGTITCYANVRIGRFKLTDGSKTVDLIPVLDWDGRAKMFDRVTATYPAHYGTFVGGPEISPVE